MGTSPRGDVRSRRSSPAAGTDFPYEGRAVCCRAVGYVASLQTHRTLSELGIHEVI